MQILCLFSFNFLLLYFFSLAPKLELFIIPQTELFLPNEIFNLKPRSTKRKRDYRNSTDGKCWGRTAHRVLGCFCFEEEGMRVICFRSHISIKNHILFIWDLKVFQRLVYQCWFLTHIHSHKRKKIKRIDGGKRWWFPFLSVGVCLIYLLNSSICIN